MRYVHVHVCVYGTPYKGTLLEYHFMSLLIICPAVHVHVHTECDIYHVYGTGSVLLHCVCVCACVVILFFIFLLRYKCCTFLLNVFFLFLPPVCLYLVHVSLKPFSHVSCL